MKKNTVYRRIICAFLIFMLVFAQAVFCVEDTASVLYENGFDTETSLDGCTVITGDGGEIKASEGKLSFVASPSYPPVSTLLFPASAADNYIYECYLNISEALNSSSRFMMLFGAKNENTSFVFTLRPDSRLDDSVELSYKTSDSSWEVLKTASLSKYTANGLNGDIFDEDGILKSDAQLHIEISVMQSFVRAYINGICVLQCFTEIEAGTFGIGSNGLKLKIDNVAVYRNIPNGKAVSQDYSNTVYEPATGIISAPTVIQTDGTNVNSYYEQSKRPAVVLYSLQLSGSVLCSYNSTLKLGELQARFDKNRGAVIPAFFVSDEQTADALNLFVSENGIFDAYVIGRTTQIIKRAVGLNDMLRGILDLSSANSVDIATITDTARKNNINTVILPHSTEESVIRALQNRVISVWLKCNDANEGFAASLKGCDGVILNASDLLLAYFEMVTEHTVLGIPLVISKGGEINTAPENTLRALTSAAENGADAIMTDVRLTMDGYAVLSRNAITKGYEKELTVASSGLAELEELACTAENAEESDRIATLNALMSAANTDYPSLVMYLNLRDSTEKLINNVLSLASDYGVTDRTVIVTSAYKTAKKALAAGVGVLYSGKTAEYNSDDVGKSVCRIYNNFALLNSPYTSENRENCVFRLHASGVRVYANASFYSPFDAVYTDDCTGIGAIPARLGVSLDDGRRLNAELTYNNGKSAPTSDIGFTPLSGSVYLVDGYVSGDGSFMIYHNYTSDNAVYRIYSEIFTTSLGKIDTTAEETSGKQTDTSTDYTTVIMLAVIGAVIIMSIGILLVLYKKGKKSKNIQKN